MAEMVSTSEAAIHTQLTNTTHNRDRNTFVGWDNDSSRLSFD
jgi:hypothetical protein